MLGRVPYINILSGRKEEVIPVVCFVFVAKEKTKSFSVVAKQMKTIEDFLINTRTCERRKGTTCQIEGEAQCHLSCKINLFILID